jgi:hypothetical protein
MARARAALACDNTFKSLLHIVVPSRPASWTGFGEARIAGGAAKPTPRGRNSTQVCPHGQLGIVPVMMKGKNFQTFSISAKMKEVTGKSVSDSQLNAFRYAFSAQMLRSHLAVIS